MVDIFTKILQEQGIVVAMLAYFVYTNYMAKKASDVEKNNLIDANHKDKVRLNARLDSLEDYIRVKLECIIKENADTMKAVMNCVGKKK